MVGQLIGSYRVTRKLGEGGMGAVYEAIHEQIARQVAIKVLLSSVAGNAQVAQRFFNEARAVNVIDHPSLVEVFDFGHLPDGTAYIVMELLKGESLTDRIHRAPGGLGMEALRITRQLASALAAAHEKQIVHRDLKPDNVMLVADPEAPGGQRAKVLDFGIAKVAEELSAGPMKTSTQMLMGTPAYMAPEQCRSSTNVDDKADVYSLGVVLFQMLSGRLPFDASDTMQLLYAHVHEPPPSLAAVVPDAPAPLASALAAMLAKQPRERPTMAEVAATMARLGGTVTGHALAASAQPNAPTMQMSSLASISLAVGEVAPHSVSAKSNAPLMILLGIIGFLVLGGIAAIVGVGFFARRWMHTSGGSVTAASGTSPSGSVATEAAPGASPHCGRFAKFLVPTPPGFAVMSCVDSNGMGSLTFTGTAAPSTACASMKKWTSGLGWTVDAETAVETTEATILHRGSEQLTVACTASVGRTMVVVSLTPRP